MGWLFSGKNNNKKLTRQEKEVIKILSKENHSYKMLSLLESSFIHLRENYEKINIEMLETLVNAEDKGSKRVLAETVDKINGILEAYLQLSQTKIEGYNSKLKPCFSSFNSTGVNSLRELVEFTETKQMIDTLSNLDTTIDGEFEGIITKIQAIKSLIVAEEMNK